MAPRAQWKGNLKFGELVCPVALYTAASTSERIAFHTLNRKTGNRIHREFVDSDSGETVEREDQVKGYELASGDYVVLEPEDIAAAVPESDKMLEISAFIACSDIDDVFFDKPYYLAPSERMGDEAFSLLRAAMEKKGVAALARTVLFRRLRTVIIRPHGKGLIATTLNFDYEVRSAKEAFESLPDNKTTGEMLDLAKHIIGMKKGDFDPSTFDDRYESALAELVKAKLEGRAPKPKPVEKPTNVTDLMEALRQSAGAMGKAQDKPEKSKAPAKKTKAATKKAPARKAKAAAKTAAPTRKAG